MSVAELERWLGALVGERCGVAPEEVEVDRALVDYGFSSRDAVELAGRLEDLLERSVPSTLLWEHPTIERIAAALLGEAKRPAPTRAPKTLEREPVAVVGLGCRLPGDISGPEDYWRLLERGGDAVGALPAKRWPRSESAADAEVLERTTRAGGFLDDIAGFDAAFFAISPREAVRMDPQQRMVLEVGWEALEHAGISPESLRGSRTGVFVGVSAGEYGQRSLSELSRVDAWSGTGGALSLAANRLSYALDLRGASVAVDTACSSSLVAVHLGMQSLMTGESDLVIAAGTNLLLGPAVTAAFHEMGVISQTGRCRPFSASADGIVRAEGAGVVVLKRLSDALADDDRIFAVLRGSAINQDGHSNGITAPNVEAQEELLRLAYGAAQVDPGDVDYVEAHGTGTLLGDPIEARALSAALGGGRRGRTPLLIGSAKSNFGHLEAAAGIVGLIKLVLSIGHRRIPANLHYSDGHPHIDFASLGLAVVDRATDWPAADRPARAGVSAFGFGGTNAHVVVEQPPAARPAELPAEGDRIGRFLLAGPDASRVRDQAEELAGWLEGPGANARLCDVEHTLARRLSGRARAAVVARDRASLIAGLRTCAEGGRAPSLVEAGAQRLDAPPVWVFSGQGSQWAGMGLRLMRDEPAFAAALRELDGLIQREAGFSVCEELERGQELTAMERLQPVLFAVQVALSRLLRARGQEPAAIVGHSLGEVAAAVASGGLSAADGARVVTLRSRLLATLTGTGAMALLELSPDELAPMLRDYPAVEIAAFNAPTQVAVAGAPAQIAELVAAVERSGRLAKQIKSVVAGHCRLVDPVVGALADGLRALVPREPHTPLYSTVLDDPRAVPVFDADYWAANIRRPVRFAQAVAAAAVDGHASFVEISPHPLLSHAVVDSARDGGLQQPVLVQTGRRCEDESAHFHAQLTALALHGGARPEIASAGARLIDLPTTRWRHVRHWLEPSPRRVPAAAHRLLGDRIELPGMSRPTWKVELDPVDPGNAGGDRFVTLTTWLETARAAATEVLRPDEEIVIRDLVLHEPRALGDRCTLSTSIQLSTPHTGRFAVHSRIGRGAWRQHLSATVETAAELEPASPAALDGAIEFVVAPAHPAEEAARSSAQVLERAIDRLVESLGPADRDAWLPRSVGEVRWRGDLDGVVLARLFPRAPMGPASPDLTTTLQLLDDEGRVRVQLDALTLRRVSATELPMALPDKLMRLEWHAVKAPRVPTAHGRWLVVGAQSDPRAGALADGLRSRGAEARAAWGAAAEQILRADHALDGVVAFIAPAPSDEDPEQAPLRGAAHVLAGAGIVRALSERPPGSAIRTRLYFATTGAAAVADGDRPDAPSAALRGLVRVLAFEHPELQPTWVDLDHGGGIDDLLSELGSTDAEDEVAWRAGRRHVARLVRPSASELSTEAARTVRADGAYLVSGGLGGLGLVLARWLAESGAARVVLNGRSAPGPRAELALAALRELGTEVVVVGGDIAHAGVAERAIAACAAPGATLRGVIHAAAAFEDRVASRLDAESLQRVWSAKAVGAWRLSAATAGLELDWWVGFSSAAALIGSPGQAAYAAANAYLDALAAWRRAQGMVATTINWGTWSQVGQAAQRSADAVSPITPTEGLEALESLLAARIPAAGVLRLDADELTDAFPDLAEIPLLSRIVGSAGRSGRQTGSAWPGVAALDPAQAPARIRARVDERVAAVLGVEPGRLDADAPLTTLGLDSLLAMRIRNALQHDFDRLLPPSLMLRGASIDDVATWLCEALDLSAPAPTAAAHEPVRRVRVAPRDAGERLVAAAWEEVLGRADFGVTDSCDEQDRDAAAADRVSELLSRRSGRLVSADQLLANPTIERQAALVREPDPASRSPLRLLREGDGAATSLFMFHPGGGDTLVYRQLVEQLDPGLTVWGLDRLSDVFTVEHRAERYVELLRKTQSTGPYLLAGWSFGGALAYETARRLQSAGERIELLAMIDTILPLPDPPETSELQVLERRFQRFADFLESSYGKPLALPYERMARLDDEAQTDLLIETILAAGLIDPVAGAAIIEHQRTSYLDVRALDRYRPGRIDGPVVLYSARDAQTDGMRDPRFDRRDPARGWDAVCGEQLEIVTVPGHHLSVLDPPHVDALAARLNELLPGLVRAAA
ncbi:MAG: polyketide synthase [Conexibacter sp.]|nr:polyketide synthase [Conexibacter sp.]